MLCISHALPVVAGELDKVQRLVEDGKYQQAQAKAQVYLSKQPDSKRALFLHALTQQKLGQNNEAIKSYEALTISQPKSPEAWNNLAVLYAAKGQHNKARDALLSAINSHPSYATAYENLGNIYAKMAVSAYNRALDTGKKDQAGPIELANINSLPVERLPVMPASSTLATAAVVPAPPPVPATAAGSATTNGNKDIEIRNITDTVNGWVNAWSAQNVDGYLAYYAPEFKPAGGMPRRQWENQRRDRLKKPRFIKITIRNTDVFLIDPQSARFSFEQAYKSDRFSDTSRKTLVLKKVNGQWQILREYAEG
jgi:tetratricopeptide (TPR) repeat protein